MQRQLRHRGGRFGSPKFFSVALDFVIGVEPRGFSRVGARDLAAEPSAQKDIFHARARALALLRLRSLCPVQLTDAHVGERQPRNPATAGDDLPDSLGFPLESVVSLANTDSR